MWKQVAGAAVLTCAVLSVAGCGSAGGPSAAPRSSVPAVPAQAVAIGRCGSVSDADIARATGLTGVQQVAANPMRCSWDAGTGADYAVIFQWFRGVSLPDRRGQVTLGTPSTVQVAGRPGMLWSGAKACEIAVASGGNDFIDWILTGSGLEPARPQGCSDLEQLAADTLAKVG
ncbi:DUF3558 family protein [Nocardia macrotermitis]|uniref:DUF3558 family protein n=1 Tax=Nocardia macrotermitis TaxID=2585198 RepID=UPI0012958DCF|nr:DUF3558 family protein [Nocardia macrotermitis]